MKQSRLFLALLGMLMAALLVEPIWAAPGQDHSRQTVPTSTPTPTPTPVSGTILGYHTVRAGETLFCIGRAYGVDPYAIALHNVIVNPSLIYAGQVLAIPWAPRILPPGRVCPSQFGGPAPTAVPGATAVPPSCRYYHTVVPGENLYRIGLRYGVNYWAIARASGISNPHFILPGWRLCIP